MEPVTVWLILFVVLAVLFFAAEMFIPSHGILSVLAIACLLGVVGLCFVLDRWLGIGAVIALVVLGPIGLSAGVTLWQKTPLGRRMVLTTTGGTLDAPAVLVGSVGRTLTELRPMGECEFDDVRVEARSEMGQLLPPGALVRVIAVEGRVATVRPTDAQMGSDT
ncbi:MAG: NfeD family protein [Tepidisphaeraceae bacterium]